MRAADYDRAATDTYHAIRQLVTGLQERGGVEEGARNLSPEDYGVLADMLALCGAKYPHIVRMAQPPEYDPVPSLGYCVEEYEAAGA